MKSDSESFEIIQLSVKFCTENSYPFSQVIEQDPHLAAGYFLMGVLCYEGKDTLSDAPFYFQMVSTCL